MNLKIWLLFGGLILLFNVQGQNEILHPQFAVNSLRPEKIIFRNEIQQAEINNYYDLLKQIVKQFEVDQSKKIAILSNGKYRSKVDGKALFSEKKDKDALKEILKDSIVQIELRYEPTYLADSVAEFFWGTINFVWTLPPPAIETLLGESFDPITQRLLEQVEPRNKNKNKIPASSITRMSAFAGLYLEETSFFFGAGLEVPLSSRFSIQNELLMNAQNYADFVALPNGKFVEADYRYRAVESRALLIGYINQKYQRFYISAGPYLEIGRQKRVATDQIPSQKKNGKLVVGAKIGIGLQMVGGLYFHAALSSPFVSNEILEYRNYGGYTFTIGYRFGRP